MAKEIPFYLITGFMDSGKTTLILTTLFGSEFAFSDEKKLVICCEDGETEYDEKKLLTVNAYLEMIESEEDFTYEKLSELIKKHKPDTIFLEYNGTWEVSKLMEMKLPEGFVLAQSIATVDATTFEMYQNNMRAMINEQIFQAELVIFNRCRPDTPKQKFRGAVKAINRPAQIIYEKEDGTIDDSEEELPFDKNKSFIDISDADYAIWFMDCMDNYRDYDGKTVHFLGLVYNPADGSLKRNIFVPGRFAMTCCVEDIQFLGLKTKYDRAGELKHKSWVDITASVKVEFAKEYRGMGPVLYAKEIKPAEKPEDDLVYFT